MPRILEQARILAETPLEDLIDDTQRNSPERSARLESFGVESPFEPAPQYSDLNVEERQMLDTIFNTLCQILELPDVDAQAFALHGLGHARHPGVYAVVQSYIDKASKTGNWTEAGIEWLKECRDGTVM